MNTRNIRDNLFCLFKTEHYEQISLACFPFCNKGCEILYVYYVSKYFMKNIIFKLTFNNKIVMLNNMKKNNVTI